MILTDEGKKRRKKNISFSNYIYIVGKRLWGWWWYTLEPPSIQNLTLKFMLMKYNLSINGVYSRITKVVRIASIKKKASCTNNSVNECKSRLGLDVYRPESIYNVRNHHPGLWHSAQIWVCPIKKWAKPKYTHFKAY